MVHNDPLFFAGAITFVAEAAETAPLLVSLVTAHPLIAPVTIAVGGVGVGGYVLWSLAFSITCNSS